MPPCTAACSPSTSGPHSTNASGCTSIVHGKGTRAGAHGVTTQGSGGVVAVSLDGLLAASHPFVCRGTGTQGGTSSVRHSAADATDAGRVLVGAHAQRTHKPSRECQVVAGVYRGVAKTSTKCADRRTKGAVPQEEQS